ncbi:hypothetical protein POTOM_058839 [Populus tomentosa]|uniref:Uncharacterized protein n=1 Tax=Populus tomentosa TaxID=118781 RepID=A0A8X7XP58_POPTO|nr:hypothetical protein POTOM_058839 [Populus tomentosa]
MLKEPLVRALKLALTCLMWPLEEVAYVDAKIFQASWEVVARAINGIMIVGACELERSLCRDIDGHQITSLTSQTILENQLYKRLFLRPYMSEWDRFLILSISRVVCFNTSQFSVIPLVEEIENIDNFLNRFQSVLLNSIILISFVLKIFLQ